MHIFWSVVWNTSLEEILLCKEEFQSQRKVKHTIKLFSSTTVLVCTAICSPGKWLSFHIFICIHIPQTHKTYFWFKKMTTCFTIYFLLLVILKIRDLCVCEMPLCILGPFIFWGLVFTYIFVSEFIICQGYYPVSSLLHICFLCFVISYFSLVKLNFFFCDVLHYVEV